MICDEWMGCVRSIYTVMTETKLWWLRSWWKLSLLLCWRRWVPWCKTNAFMRKMPMLPAFSKLAGLKSCCVTSVMDTVDTSYWLSMHIYANEWTTRMRGKPIGNWNMGELLKQSLLLCTWISHNGNQMFACWRKHSCRRVAGVRAPLVFTGWEDISRHYWRSVLQHFLVIKKQL